MDIKKKLKAIPDSAGVYIMKDRDGKVIYVGKASSLKKRVFSYFQKGVPSSYRQGSLVSNIADLDFILTGSEEEALIYEANLIKENQPKYNARLRDDKSYPFLKLTVNEEYPRLFITRKLENDGARYFGPYTHVKLLRRALSIIRRMFPLRTCKKFPAQKCLNFYIGQCFGVCETEEDRKRYDETVKELIIFLEGRKQALLKELTQKMESSARAQNFEEAKRYRDIIFSLTAVTQRGEYRFSNEVALRLKKILRLPKIPVRIEAFDVSNISGKEATGSMVHFEDGKPDKRFYRQYRIGGVEGIDDYKMMREVVRRRYSKVERLPDLIIIDGGKGHLACAYEELLRLGLGYIPIIGIAKEFERIYLSGIKEPLDISGDVQVLHLIQNIRDEAHRFAQRYHHKLRGRLITISGLDGIEGIGEKRKKALMMHFGSIENIRAADVKDILGIARISEGLAQKVKEVLKK